ncbi:hypothetical protein CL689_06625 [Candidatus Saccharibacteria bacterium]|nr:hypothetical protein [Candidatus Saccharibacteria bacterium]|tara:strand:+ start:505 stop:1014 length:510 start_codon:yes stop_codon:yes gene_type:complete
MKKLSLLALLALSITATPVFAQGPYVAADYGFYSAGDGALSVEFGALGVAAGYQINDFVGAELRASAGVHDDNINGINVGLNNYLGMQAVAFLPLDRDFSVYGTVGYGRLEAQASSGNIVATASESGVSYGLGFQVKSGALGLRLGYESLLDESGTSVEGLKITGLYSF